MFFKYRRLLLSLPRQYGGKTELGVRIAHDLTGMPFPSSSLFLAKDKRSGKKATREKFERIFDKKTFCVNTENVYLKQTPSSIIFMDSVDKDPDRIRGGTYSYIHWSEVAFSKIEKGEDIISVFNKVLSPTLTQTDGYALLESTNNGKNGWFELWETGHEFGFKRLVIGLDRFVEMGLITLEEFDKIKGQTLPEIFRQEYLCEWVTFQGKAYPELTDWHIWADMPPPEAWQRVIVGIDWGYSPSATAMLFGYVRDGVLCIFDEVYEHEQLAAHSAEELARRQLQWGIDNVSVVADHEADRNEELTRRGIPCAQAQKTNVMGARIEIKERLYFNKMRIHPRCKHLRRELDSAVWDLKKEGELDYSQDTIGHHDCEAALRYLIRELGEAEADEPQQNPFLDLDSASARASGMARSLFGD